MRKMKGNGDSKGNMCGRRGKLRCREGELREIEKVSDESNQEDKEGRLRSRNGKNGGVMTGLSFFTKIETHS
jgi:hypothetical protein